MEHSLIRQLIRIVLQTPREGQRWHHAMLDLFRGIRSDSLLDVGCGDGSWSVELAGRLGVPPGQLSGMEMTPGCLESARKNLNLFEVNVESMPFPFPEQTFGVVTSNQILEHLRNPFFCLAECQRVLKVNGYLAVGIPNLAGLLNRLYLLMGRQPICLEFPGPHVRGFAHSSFLSFLRSNGAFELVKCHGSSLYPFPPPFLERGARRFPGGSAYTFYLLKKVRHTPSSDWLKGEDHLDSVE